MANIIQFPGTRQTALQRVQSSYSLRDVQKQFGISEKLLRKWAEAGAVETVPGKEGEIRFGLGALARFRSIREERTRGKTLKQIDEEMRGQLDLFASRPSGIVRSLSEKRTPFEEGLILLDRGDASAASFFQKALEQDDHCADAHCNLGILAFESGDVPGAMTEFIRALESEPGHFESHYDLETCTLTQAICRSLKCILKLQPESNRNMQILFSTLACSMQGLRTGRNQKNALNVIRHLRT